MIHRGSALFWLPVVATLLAVLTLAATLASVRASGDEVARCDRFARASAERAAADVGSGRRIAVIGDSYSVGLGLDHPAHSWPSRLPGRVHVDGFSGSGFSALASDCGRVSFAERATAARDAGIVVVEGGLNDVDRSDAEIRAGFERLMQALAGHRVVVVGPAAAPSRASGVPRVDGLLAELAAEHGATYLRMSSLTLPYLADDRLHLTAEGHRLFGDAVADLLERVD